VSGLLTGIDGADPVISSVAEPAVLDMSVASPRHPRRTYRSKTTSGRRGGQSSGKVCGVRGAEPGCKRQFEIQALVITMDREPLTLSRQVDPIDLVERPLGGDITQPAAQTRPAHQQQLRW
jgi:hypothetical protein